MVKTLLLILVCCIFIQAGAQDFKGRKMLTTSVTAANLNFNSARTTENGTVTGSSRSVSFSISPELAYGKVNRNNLLVAYGINAGYSHSRNKNSATTISRHNGYAIGPLFYLQKFIPISGKVFYAPAGRATATWAWSTNSLNSHESNSIQSAAGIMPFSIAFNIRPKANLLFQVGYLGVSYFETRNENNGLPGEYQDRSRSFNVTASASSFNIGYQLLL